MPNPQPGQMGDWRCINCKRIVLNNVEPESCWDCKGKLFARIVPASGRPTPDGEIGELVAWLRNEARSYAAKLTPRTVCAARDDGYRPPLPEETTFWKAATTLETQAADIARLREALRVAARGLEIVSETMAEQGFGQSVNLDACALMARAALATRTDVR